jgi:NADPH:quinone reductase-like Zn-dependent oxidoreductase
MLPFAAGFEAVGEVVAVGEGVKGFKVGSPVATLSYGGFAEYSLVRPLVCFVVSSRCLGFLFRVGLVRLCCWCGKSCKI